MKKPLTQERLKEVISYDPETGIFEWLVRPRQRAMSRIAGTTNPNGYRQIGIDQRVYKAHRLGWFYVHGVWPSKQIDHLNGDRLDNRIANLREADFSQNQANSKRRITNKSGHKGVYFHSHSGLWVARVYKNYKNVYAKYFKTKEAAAEAYRVMSIEFHDEFARAA